MDSHNKLTDRDVPRTFFDHHVDLRSFTWISGHDMKQLDGMIWGKGDTPPAFIVFAVLFAVYASLFFGPVRGFGGQLRCLSNLCFAS
jgi:hypothetical protein